MKKAKDTKDQMMQSKRSTSVESASYASWIAELKRRYRATQIKAAVAVNSALIEFYWTLGRDVTERYSEANLGNEFYRKMSLDLKDGNEEVKGLSPQTLKYCGYFYRLYAISAGGQQVVDLEKMQQIVAQLILVPWGHHVQIIDKCKGDRDKALFYVRRTIQNGWSRNSLLNWLSTDLYEREGKAQTNFDLTMPSDDCDLARQLVKDPQKFEVFGSSFLHRAVASLSRRGGQDRQVRTCRSRPAERLHGDCEACLEHAGRQPARRASDLQGTQPRLRQVPFGGTWPADGHHRLRTQEGTPHQGAIGQVRHRRRTANRRGFNGPSYESVKLGDREVIG